MVEDALGVVREAAKAMLTGLGLMQGIYLGMMGFSGFIPKTMPFRHKAFFIIPLLAWLGSIYFSLRVMKTQRLKINLHDPDDIREKSEQVLTDKQRSLNWSFWMLALGLIAAFLLITWRLRIQ